MIKQAALAIREYLKLAQQRMPFTAIANKILSSGGKPLQTTLDAVNKERAALANSLKQPAAPKPAMPARPIAPIAPITGDPRVPGAIAKANTSAMVRAGITPRQKDMVMAGKPPSASLAEALTYGSLKANQ